MAAQRIPSTVFIPPAGSVSPLTMQSIGKAVALKMEITWAEFQLDSKTVRATERMLLKCISNCVNILGWSLSVLLVSISVIVELIYYCIALMRFASGVVVFVVDYAYSMLALCDDFLGVHCLLSVLLVSMR